MTIITIQLLWVPDDIKQQYDDDDGILAIQGLCYIFSSTQLPNYVGGNPVIVKQIEIQHATIQLDSRCSPRSQSSRLLPDAWSWGWGLDVVQGRLIMLFIELYSVI